MKTKLLLLALLTVGFAQSQNLIQNGGFESFTGTTPDSWTILNGTTSKEETIKNEGTSSFKGLTVGDLNIGMMPSLQFKQEFTLTNTDEYTLSFDYFIPAGGSFNISNFSYEIKKVTSDVLFFDVQEMVTKEFGIWKTVTKDFKALTFTAPTTSATIALYFTAGSQVDGKTIYFDNVVIAKKSTLGTADFNKKSSPIAVVTKNEIKLNNEYKDSSYTIYSIDGKAVKRGKNNSSDIIEISGLNKGVYLLKLSDASSSVKFIKQ
ncbi:T9SS type A sorting domain-containing protein [Flavobacterium sp.]|uniref:T9SS type A sorting domain-containing protein n=1 Tax=Flavobacterium sp. TaxID=239 RepID=UPI002C0E137A|nr:T9SS type A sorting domain-containing protein [Flavobacterium sp.]HSD07964.1 T9SS type A sorting domain-containing protein [Flavobacterium sp.]